MRDRKAKKTRKKKTIYVPYQPRTLDDYVACSEAVICLLWAHS